MTSSSYRAEELSVLEDQIAVREKAVAIAEKNAAAIHAVNVNVKQAQAKSMRLSMGRRQHVVVEESALANDIQMQLLKHEAEEQSDPADISLPPLDVSARPSVVAEKVADDCKRKLSGTAPFTGTSSPVLHPQSSKSHKAAQVFNFESARNVVSAVMQMGFTFQDQETFTAVLVEKVNAIYLPLSQFTPIQSRYWPLIYDRYAPSCGPVKRILEKLLPSTSLFPTMQSMRNCSNAIAQNLTLASVC